MLWRRRWEVTQAALRLRGRRHAQAMLQGASCLGGLGGDSEEDNEERPPGTSLVVRRASAKVWQRHQRGGVKAGRGPGVGEQAAGVWRADWPRTHTRHWGFRRGTQGGKQPLPTPQTSLQRPQQPWQPLPRLWLPDGSSCRPGLARVAGSGEPSRRVSNLCSFMAHARRSSVNFTGWLLLEHQEKQTERQAWH